MNPLHEVSKESTKVSPKITHKNRRTSYSRNPKTYPCLQREVSCSCLVHMGLQSKAKFFLKRGNIERRE